MKKYYIKTFGCQMNYADSEKINMILLQSGFMVTNEWEKADVIIFNTCSVRQKWEDKVFWMIREIVKYEEKILSKMSEEEKEKYEKKIVWITWCMVRKTWMAKDYLEENIDRTPAREIETILDEKGIYNYDDKLFPRTQKLDFTLRIEDVKYLNKILSHIYWAQIWNDDKFDDYLKQKQLRESNASANIIIQTWCDNFCTFCIVPYTRWREVSRPMEEIVAEAKKAVQEWAKEITLLWQNVNSYGKQKNPKLWNEEKSMWNSGIWKSPFRELLEELNKIEWLYRIRFTSSNPHDMTQDILDAHFDLEKTCNYLHFALQSWDDKMLKKMNRRHKYEKFKEMVEYMRKRDPLFSISTDIIVWYSWETQEQFEATVEALKDLEFDFVYIARYSVRPWTMASKAFPDDISGDEKAKRWHTLNTHLEESVHKRNALMIWREEEILVTHNENGKIRGRTRNFKEVFCDYSWGDIKVWDLIKVKVEDLDNWILKWSVI